MMPLCPRISRRSIELVLNSVIGDNAVEGTTDFVDFTVSTYDERLILVIFSTTVVCKTVYKLKLEFQY